MSYREFLCKSFAQWRLPRTRRTYKKENRKRCLYIHVYNYLHMLTLLRIHAFLWLQTNTALFKIKKKTAYLHLISLSISKIWHNIKHNKNTPSTQINEKTKSFGCKNFLTIEAYATHHEVAPLCSMQWYLHPHLCKEKSFESQHKVNMCEAWLLPIQSQKLRGFLYADYINFFLEFFQCTWTIKATRHILQNLEDSFAVQCIWLIILVNWT